MTSRDPDLDHLTTLLGRCLGRIDEQAYRLLHRGEDDEHDGTADLLEEDTGTLQELIDTMLVVADEDETDVNRTVERVATSCLQEVDMPIVLRQNLLPDLPTVACPPAMVTYALQRAMVLAVSMLEPGGELAITTRLDDGSVLVEIESQADEFDDQLLARAETLKDFVGGFGGQCRVDCDQQHNLFVVLELPQVMATDGS